jgi:hypothetical protein
MVSPGRLRLVRVAMAPPLPSATSAGVTAAGPVTTVVPTAVLPVKPLLATVLAVPLLQIAPPPAPAWLSVKTDFTPLTVRMPPELPMAPPVPSPGGTGSAIGGRFGGTSES